MSVLIKLGVLCTFTGLIFLGIAEDSRTVLGSVLMLVVGIGCFVMLWQDWKAASTKRAAEDGQADREQVE